MRHIKIILHILFFLVGTRVYSQTFSNRYDTLEEGSYDSVSLIYDENGITTLGVRFNANIDGLGSFDRVVFTRISEDGELVYEKYLYEPFHDNKPGTHNSLCKIEEDYVFAGWTEEYLLVNDSTFSSLGVLPQITRVDNSGEIEWRKEYSFPGEENFFMQSIPASDGGIIAIGQTFAGEAQSQDVLLVKVDNEGELVWYKTFGHENQWDLCSSITPFTDSLYIIGGHFDITPGIERAQMYVVDLEGNIVEHFTNYSLDLQPIFSTSAYPIDDEYFYVPLPKIIEQDDLDLENHTGLMNSDFELEWTTNIDLVPEDDLAVYNRTVNDDGDLIFIGKTQSSDHPALNEVIVGKVTQEGDFEWLRSYVYSEFGVNLLNGLDTYQNEIVLSGFVVHVPPDGYEVGEQDLWVLKLDEHGCLIDGCQNNSIEEFPESSLIIYPNPSSDVMFVDLSQASSNGKQLELVMHDSFGKEVNRMPIINPESTYIIPVSHLAKGMYFVSVYSSNEKVVTHKTFVN